MTQPCNGIDFWVSSGNAGGNCRAVVDDQTARLRAMTCDDGNRNAATLACADDGHVTCAAMGTGICATDVTLVRSGGSATAKLGYFAYRCGIKNYYVALGSPKGGGATGSCLPTFNRATGARAIHCDDGAGDSAEFVCRDDVGACSNTGTGVCTTDDTVVRQLH